MVKAVKQINKEWLHNKDKTKIPVLSAYISGVIREAMCALDIVILNTGHLDSDLLEHLDIPSSITCLDHKANFLTQNPMRHYKGDKHLILNSPTYPLTREMIPVLMINILKDNTLDIVYIKGVESNREPSIIPNLFTNTRALFIANDTGRDYDGRRSFGKHHSAKDLTKQINLNLQEDLQHSNLYITRTSAINNIEDINNSNINIIVNVLDTRRHPNTYWLEFEHEYYYAEDNYLVTKI